MQKHQKHTDTAKTLNSGIFFFIVYTCILSIYILLLLYIHYYCVTVLDRVGECRNKGLRGEHTASTLKLGDLAIAPVLYGVHSDAHIDAEYRHKQVI